VSWAIRKLQSIQFQRENHIGVKALNFFVQEARDECPTRLDHSAVNPRRRSRMSRNSARHLPQTFFTPMPFTWVTRRSRMKYILALLFCSLVSSHLTDAQEPQVAAMGPVVKASIGLAYLDFDLASSVRQRLLGVTSQASMDLSPRFAAEVEVGYLRASDVFRSGHHSDALTYLAGPVWYPTRRGFQPYVHSLVGLARITGPVPIAANEFEGGMVNKLAWELGAGAELHLRGPVYIRIGADYLHSSFFSRLLTIRGQNSFRTIASFEYVFGSHRRR